MTLSRESREQRPNSNKPHQSRLPFQQYGLALNPQRALKIEQAIASILTSVNILPLGITEAEHAAQNYLSLKN